MLGFEFADRLPNLLFQLVFAHHRIGREVISGRWFRAALDIKRAGQPVFSPPQMADAQVLEYLIEPRKEPTPRLDLLDIPICPNERLLRQIQGILSIPNKAQRDEIGVFHIFIHEDFKRLS